MPAGLRVAAAHGSAFLSAGGSTRSPAARVALFPPAVGAVLAVFALFAPAVGAVFGSAVGAVFGPVRVVLWASVRVAADHASSGVEGG
ncbi:hypothetical protein [Couchioplanes azureus]|uniref:hypothetical protein n=1 Tax=Couchioplanes caeruleus TaxID=56438 RepID=UPI00166FD86A|nr:hypothetical protein [Couchioplanes caeruleus]